MAFGAHEPPIGFDARKSHRERIAAEEAHRRMPPREGGIPKAHPLTNPMRSELRWSISRAICSRISSLPREVGRSSFIRMTSAAVRGCQAVFRDGSRQMTEAPRRMWR